jgi:3-oxoacyl-(acyl-carrier-protein) synthase
MRAGKLESGTCVLGARSYDRYSHLAMGAAKDALADGGLSVEDIDSFRFGVLIGSGIGGLQAVENSCRCVAAATARARWRSAHGAWRVQRRAWPPADDVFS